MQIYYFFIFLFFIIFFHFFIIIYSMFSLAKHLPVCDGEKNLKLIYLNSKYHLGV